MCALFPEVLAAGWLCTGIPVKALRLRLPTGQVPWLKQPWSSAIAKRYRYAALALSRKAIATQKCSGQDTPNRDLVLRYQSAAHPIPVFPLQGHPNAALGLDTM